jgi:hypothetical protein
MSMEGFVERPLRVALALSEGGSGGSAVEAHLLIAGLISCMAAHVWPGSGVDKKRFVEFWLRFAKREDAKRIAVPLLHQDYRRAKKLKEVRALEAWRPTLLGLPTLEEPLDGGMIDDSESALTTVLTVFETSAVRRHSYPSVFYEVVRNGLVHEDELLVDALGRKLERPTAGPSFGVHYTNDDRDRHGKLARIHFGVPWLIELTASMAARADRALARDPAPQANPPQWWLP